MTRRHRYSDVAKKGRPRKPESKRSQGVDRHVSPRIGFHLADHLNEALRALAARNRRDLTSELTIAIEEHLRKFECLPDPPADA